MDNKEINLLIKQYRKGDNNALSSIYIGTKRQVFSLAYTILNNYSLAEQIMEDTYVRFIEKLSMYKDGTNAKAFLLTITRNLALDEYRRLSKNKTYDSEMEEYNLVGEEMEDFSTPILDLAKKELSPDDYKIFVLHVVTELTHREISELLKKPIGTIMWRYNRTIKHLKNIIESKGIDNFI